MIIRTAKKEDTKKIRDLWDKCFDEDSLEWRDWYFENTYKCENVECLFINDDLVSMIHLNPYTLSINGREVKAFAMAGVATDDKFRKKGYADILIKHSLNVAYEKGYEYSFLYPFNYEFYEKYGYKLSYMKYSYKQNYIDSMTFENKLKVEPDYSNGELSRIYSQFCKNQNGYVLRDEKHIKKHIEECSADNYKLISFKIGEEKGYFFYSQEHPNQIDEMAYTGNLKIAYKAIGDYLKKDIKFANQIYDSSLDMEEKPHCMARVINAEFFSLVINDYDKNMKTRIKDEIIADNNIICNDDEIDCKGDIIDIKEITTKVFKNMKGNAYIIEVC